MPMIRGYLTIQAVRCIRIKEQLRRQLPSRGINAKAVELLLIIVEDGEIVRLSVAKVCSAARPCITVTAAKDGLECVLVKLRQTEGIALGVKEKDALVKGCNVLLC